MISSIIQVFVIKIQSNSDQEKKRQRIYDLLNAETIPRNIFEIIGVYLGLPSSPDLSPVDYIIWVVLKNRTNATSHSNIGMLDTAIEEEWKKMSKEFILKACKLFRRLVDTITE